MDGNDYKRAVFEAWQARARWSQEVAAGYGRWLLASLVIIHAGALFGMFSFLANHADKPSVISGYALPIWCFIAGLMLAFLAGLTTWVNWGLNSAEYEHQADYNMLITPDKWLNPPKYLLWLRITFWAPVAFGVCSALTIPMAAWLILYGVSIQPHRYIV